MTIKDMLRVLTREFSDISDAPDLDAQWIVLHVLGEHHTSFLISNADTKLFPDQQSQIEELASKRLNGMPLAYVLGYWEFYGRRFTVTPDVLVPRPDTEQLVDTALDVISHIRNDSITIADIGTGSGCIAITLALEAPRISRITATDISHKALEVAQENAKQHNVQDRIQFLQGDMLDPIQNKDIDLIVSNPPYVPSEELTRTQTTDTAGLAFEPQHALDGGLNGSEYVEQIVQSNMPAVVETHGGRIATYNIPE